MRARYLVCYDITDERRLTRVFRLLKARGLHFQYSVFLCSLTWPELNELTRQVADLIDPAADDVRVYPVPSGDVITALGRGDRTPDGSLVVLP